MKRVADITLALVLLFVLSPVLTVVGAVVGMAIGRPVLFVQERAGRRGQPFPMVKFRTMTDESDADGQLLPDAARATRLGAILRARSLDELPQLWNVLRGDMSLVGPRPLYVRYLDRYSQQQARRHEVRPGMTGWAQINGRDSIDWAEQFEMDVWYVNNRSARLDARILWRSLQTLLGLGPASDVAPRPEFQGCGQETAATVSADRSVSVVAARGDED